MPESINIRQKVRDELSRIAAGGAPDGIDLTTFGIYEPVIREAYTLYAETGLAGVRAYIATEAIAPLVAGDPTVTKNARYTLHWASEALTPQPPIEWVVTELFSAGSVSLIVGEGGCGKTWALLDCAVSVALGQPWLEHAVQGVAVLIVDEESGPRRLARRLGDVLRGHAAGPETPIAYITLARFDLGKAEDIRALEAAIIEAHARLVIIDALADVMLGRDENTVKEVQPIFVALRGIAEAQQAAIVIIHHTNRAGRYRGSTAIKGAVDLLLLVENDNAGLLTFKSDKARDVQSVHFSTQMHFLQERFYLTSATAAAPPPVFNKGELFVLRYLQQHGPAEISAITSAADTCSSGTARNAVYALASKGLTTRVDSGGQGQAASYDLTDAGIAVCTDL